MSVLSAMSKRRCSQSCPSPYSRCVLTGVHVTCSLSDEHSLRYVTYQPPPPQWCQRKVEMSPLVTGPLRRRRLMEHRPLRRFGLERRERSDRSPTGMVRRRFVGGPRLLLRLGHLHSPSNRLLVFHRHRLLAFAEQPHGAISRPSCSTLTEPSKALHTVTAAPRNVSLAGVPRWVSKLHRPWLGGGLPARASFSFVPRGAEITVAQLRGQAVRMWTRPSDRAPTYGPCGQGMDKCTALAHSLPTLGALAPTSTPLLQQSIHGKGNGTGSGRFPHYSVIPGNPSTEYSDQFLR